VSDEHAEWLRAAAERDSAAEAHGFRNAWLWAADHIDKLRTELAAERARADDLRRVLDAERERGTAFMADRDRLRELLSIAAEFTRHPDYDWDIGFARDVAAALAEGGAK